ncbi:hypothetical protein BaRGS_00031234 [Batillaria attramentaria]|uniref:Uncharacterized protein n=1 Tax=Batillaria attramentaria TaxID=370345 RepID=A0ABD0JSD7_9CAEN
MESKSRFVILFDSCESAPCGKLTCTPNATEALGYTCSRPAPSSRGVSFHDGVISRVLMVIMAAFSYARWSNIY